MGKIELLEYIQPLRKWWWLLVLTTTIGGISSFMFVQSQPLEYQSQTTILVGAGVEELNPNSAQFRLTEQLAQVYAAIADRTPVRQATMVALNVDRLPEYTVSVVPDSPFIEIVVRDQDPALAQAVANELVNQLILQSPAGQEEHERQQFIVAQLAKLEAGIQETEDEIEHNQAELVTLFSAREIANTQDTINALQNKLSSLRSNYSALLGHSQQGATNRIAVVEPAALPRYPIRQQPILTILVALVMGLTVGMGGAYLLEFLDDSIQSSHEVQKQLDIPLLASIPSVAGTDMLLTSSVIPAGVIESYRALRTNLQYKGVARTLHVILLTGPAPHDGKSIITANLCIALARAGMRVILVDADMHRPRQHQFFQVTNTVGLSTVLQGTDVDWSALLKGTVEPNLKVITSGPLPINPAELLSSLRMQQLLDKLHADADIIILDTPPVSAVVDATILASQVDGVLFVVRANQTAWAMAKRTLGMLQQVGAPMLGIVLNAVTPRQGAYSHLEYGYGLRPTKELSGLQSGNTSAKSEYKTTMSVPEYAPAATAPKNLRGRGMSMILGRRSGEQPHPGSNGRNEADRKDL